MAGLGIYHYNARFYSPKLGRFLSPDTIVPGAANPQAYNRYSYVLGNPLKYTDPTGHSQYQTQEDCADMGTTPMGTGNPHNGGGSNNNGNNGNPHDDDNDIDPNPGGIVIDTDTEESGPACPTCILLGVAIILTMLPIEATLGVGFVLALTPPLLPLEILVVPLEAAALHITLVGIEFIAQGQENTLEEIDIDPLPLLNLFNPDLWK